MAKSSKAMGLLCLCGAVLFFAGVIMAIALFDRGAYSPASGFVTELGQYKNGYFTVSSALYFNVGIVIFGLTFGLFMVWRGSRGETTLHAATGLTGAFAGVLMAAQGIFTLNFPQYHYIVAAVFYFAAALFCVLQIALWLKGGRSERFGLALLIIFFVAGALCLVSGVITATGGFVQVIKEDISGAGRLLFVPAAALGWLAVGSVWIAGILISVSAMAAAVADNVSPTAGKPVKGHNDFVM